MPACLPACLPACRLAAVRRYWLTPKLACASNMVRDSGSRPGREDVWLLAVFLVAPRKGRESWLLRRDLYLHGRHPVGVVCGMARVLLRASFEWGR